jgi:N-acetylmuramoyl-L-alanine amidase
MIKRIAYIFISLFVCTIFASNVFALDNSVIKTITSDDAGKLIFITGTNFDNISSLKTFKLSNPERTVLDLPNTILAGKKQSLDIDGSGINNIKISQFSTYPNVVRIVFSANKTGCLDKIKIIRSKNSLLLGINPVESPKKSYLPTYQDRETNKKTEDSEQSANTSIINIDNSNKFDLIINAITNKNNNLTISGTGSFSLKEPIVLQNPSRIVFDISNATSSLAGLPKTYTFINGDILKVSQFNSKTVRISIQTNNIDNYKSILSPDLQTLMISSKDKINTSDMPNGKIISQIKKIDVRKIDKTTTIITLNATNPIIHYIRRLYSPDSLKIELYNVNMPDKNILANLPKTDQFQGLSANNIEKYTGGSSLMISLNKITRVESSLSFDGKTIEIILKDIPVKVCADMPRSKARVIIDPGHGGNEPGAIKDNIFEKDITLDVAKKVKNYLNQAGVDVVMTRSDDETISLKQRTMITCEVNPEVFVSIHVNSCEASSVTGLETHWYTPQSKKLAQIIQTKMTNSINSPDRGIMNSMFYVIHHTDVPAVLVEMGFMSNSSERQQLLTPERQETTARSIADGIIKFLNTKSSD